MNNIWSGTLPGPYGIPTMNNPSSSIDSNRILFQMKKEFKRTPISMPI
jgi:hypothetical protein